ncbi:ferredoxin [Desulfonatronum thiosulfatophilum]|uniref:Ferredoxin n=1 Tax=Desulfonatronum thiosulfatophilum TaxID=617002 RepID=A0A1G6CKT7_9BACT|nr:ferredoxin [Desulfonatronum thiosulfatophilum]SDB33497.1 ferredoxin [Desulfonatronum thiosulfatophilum]
MLGKIVIDQEECIGCGTCESICPQVFRLDEDAAKAVVIMARGGPSEYIEEAMESCPQESIQISWARRPARQSTEMEAFGWQM